MKRDIKTKVNCSAKLISECQMLLVPYNIENYEHCGLNFGALNKKSDLKAT
jgi:hypothetical protein